MTKIVDRTGAMGVLPKSFHAFLGSFSKLTPIQAHAIMPVLSKEDCVLVAPTASGKTEAAVAPLCENILNGPSRLGVSLLYIVPTRALSNDIEARIKGPTSTLGLVTTVRTGDRPATVRNTDLLITTPESFDSMLCRQPDVFENLQAVLIDEAHQIDGTARGDQLRILLRRLKGWHVKQRPQFIAMTATVAQPEEMGHRFFGKIPLVVKAGQDRPLTIDWAEDPLSASKAMRADGLTKAIFFCNSRRKAETVGLELARSSQWPKQRVMVHHGSLSRKEREDVEKAFKRFEAALLVSTNTMELGVDVGDVDAVALVGPPDSLASFYQRVGRGCRRKAGMRAWCIAANLEEKGQFEGILKAMKEEGLPEIKSLPDLSVLVQQIFSVLFWAKKPIARRWIVELLKVLAKPSDIDLILDHLISEGFVDTSGGDKVKASTALMDLGEKGTIHSNIGDSKTVTVIDDSTGRVLGKVSAATAESFTMAGREWAVTGGGKDAIRVVSHSGLGDSGTPVFGPRTSVGAFYRYLPESLK